jgi:DNA polymerase elongation subunit (family B)
MNDNVIVYERDAENKRIQQVYKAPYYFYVDDPDGEYNTIFGTKVSKLTFKNGRDYYGTRKSCKESGIQTWESDIPPEIRVLSNFYYNKPAMKLNITFWDIEVDYNLEMGFSSPKYPYAPINSVSLFHQHRDEMVILCVPPPGQPWTAETLMEEVHAAHPLPTEYKTIIKVFPDERELLLEFLDQIEDTDLLSGWNSDFFDLPYTTKRIERTLGSTFVKRLSFTGAQAPQWNEVEFKKQINLVVNLYGRMSLDYMQLFRKYEPGERHSYKLASIEEEVGLNLPKLNYQGSLHELYHQDFPFFVRYNMRDSEILRGFELTLGYVDVASQMYHISCGQASHVQGTLKLAELAIVNYCHHVLKQVVPNIERPDVDRKIDGAFVLLPQIGMHEQIGSIDITSLYPTAIRSVNISPEMIVGQFTATSEAHVGVINGTDELFLFEYDNETTETKSGAEWKQHLIDNKWSISGYGTVFSQEKQGIIPAVLSDWFATRKKYQNDKKTANAAAVEILKKYMSEEEAIKMVSRAVTEISEVLTETSAYDDTDEEEFDEF